MPDSPDITRALGVHLRSADPGRPPQPAMGGKREHPRRMARRAREGRYKALHEPPGVLGVDAGDSEAEGEKATGVDRARPICSRGRDRSAEIAERPRGRESEDYCEGVGG